MSLIVLEGVEKVYPMGKTEVRALRGVDITIEEGEYVAIMGPSGSGKSTLMNIIGCLDTPTKGKYILKGTDTRLLSDEALAQIRNKEIGFVFQTFNLLPRMDALGNVELPLIYARVPKRERRKKAEKMLEKVGLAERFHHLPNELSGGQQQRVAIARALINEPSLILADEPTGNLDSQSSEEIMALFDNLHQEGHTLVVVTHERDVAEHAERIIFLLDGKVKDDHRES